MYTPHSAAPVEEQVAAAVEGAGAPDGHTLVFLPGVAEIRRTMRACEGVARRYGFALLPLYGDLSPEEQDRAVQPSETPKLILSTNVAESSVTIDGVTTVIDSGLARIASDSPDTGLPVVEVRRISKASAIQRAGRAGRTRPGQAIRLYSQEDFLRRPEHEIAEIRRRDLSQTVLELRALGIADLPWFETPPEQAWRAAEELLDRLGVRDHARELARYPLHPRLSRMILEATARGVASEACRLAAFLSSGDRFEHIDILDCTESQRSYKVDQIDKQIRRIVRPRPGTYSDEALRISLLAAYPDRVAKRRSGRDFQLCNGAPALLAEEYQHELLVAVDIEERREAGAPMVRAASAVQPDWLIDLFPERISERSEVFWNRAAERVEARDSLRYDEIAIYESAAVADADAAGQLLAERAIDAGLHRFTDVEELEAFLERTAFAAQHGDIPHLGEADVHDALRELCTGIRSFAELKQLASGDGLIGALRVKFGPQRERLLNDIAPERIALKKRQVKVHYARDQQPWIASRLQDFFGIRETPRVGRGQVPVIVHLLAPNQRPVQMTADLAGFWERLYPQVRRELSRRYPKHAWPEKPDQ
jgi:ATP-dependent helicase HrpB